VGHIVWDVFSGLDQSVIGDAFRTAMESGVPTHTDDYFVQSKAHLEAHAYPSEDGLTVFFHDVTETRRIAAAQAESEALLRLFIDRAPAASAMFDTDMRYLAASRRFARDYHLGDGLPETLVGLSHSMLFPEMADRWRNIHRRVISGEVLSAADDAFPRADGHIDWVRWEMAPWRHADGTIGGAVLFWEIVTDRKETERALRGLTEDLTARLRENEELVLRVREEVDAREAAQVRASQAERVQALGQLAGGMAHDFNNLLAVIILNLGFARSRMADSDAMKQLVVDALAAARSGADLIRSLLAFARGQALNPVRSEINKQISGMHRMLSRVLGEHIEIVLDLAPGLWPVIADASQVEASIVNLATNARDAMPRGGGLTIATGNQRLDADYARVNPTVTPGDYVMISVSDTGMGMPPDVAARVFEPFFTTKEQGKGTGLGLSMVFGFVNQSGGHISVYSEVGVGSTIRLFLPRAVDATAILSDAAAPPPVAMVGGRGETVLVVEDNAAMRLAVVDQLTSLNYRVIETDNAAAALVVLETQPVDLLFSDAMMPGGMDGFALAEQARLRWPTVSVLLTSDFSTEVMSGRFWGVEPPPRLLGKPYDREQLAGAVRESLDA
jgi:PAS domain S-box-containing protein